MGLWRVLDQDSSRDFDVPMYESLAPVCVKECKSAQKVRALVFNERARELAALSLNGYIHVWSAENFQQVCIVKVYLLVVLDYFVVFITERDSQ